MPVKVFCSYSHHPDDRKLKAKLDEHLSILQRKGRITAYWSDEKLSAGKEFDPAIQAKLKEANLILVLLSASYVHSDYCWDRELLPAVGRYKAGGARVVPILLSAMNWDVPPINQLHIIPTNRMAVESWPNTNEAFAEITQEVEHVIDEVEDHLALIEADALQIPSHAAPAATSTSTSGNNDSRVFHCIPRFGDPTALRSLGITELLPDLVLQFRGDPGERRFADIWVYANACVTSRIVGLDNLSEATLSLATGHVLTGLPTLRHNIRARQGAVGALGFLHVPLHELRALPPAERNLRIANIRVNAAQLGMSIPKPTEIILNLMVSDTTVTPTQQLSVAIVAGTFQVLVASADPQVDLSRLPQSQSMNAGMLAERRIADRFTALLTCTGRLAGYEPLGERTRVRLDVANVSDGVSLFVTADQVSSEPARLSATLTQTDQFGNGRGKEPKIDGHIIASSRTLALSKIDLHSGRGYATWELDGGLLEDTQTVTLGIILVYVGDPSKKLPGLGTATARVTLAPAGGPLASMPLADPTAPIPRFVDASVVEPLFSIVP